MEKAESPIEHYIVYSGTSVALAAMQKEYIRSLMPWINNPMTTAGVLLSPPVTYESELKWYDSMQIGGDNIVFAILARDMVESAWRYIGHTGLHHITFPEARAESGTIIGDSSVHGKGYGTEAKLMLLHHAFYVEGLRKVYSQVKAFNGSSIGHLLKCGYKITGIRRQHYFHQGNYVDDVQLEIFKEDFDSIWNQYKEYGVLPPLTRKQKTKIKKLT